MNKTCLTSPRPWVARALLTSTALACALWLAACGGGGGSSAPAAAPSPIQTPTPTPTPVAPTIYDASAAPSKLSAWNLASISGSTLTLNAALVPYDLNTALFSDYAFKLRAIYVPPGKAIAYTDTGTLDLPVGSALVKTFYYPKATGTDASAVPVAQKTQTAQGSSIDLTGHRLVETRILVRQADGSWAGLPYVWDDDQKDATLTPAGKYISMELVPDSGPSQKFIYAVPNAQTCQQCHASSSNGSGSTLPIGPKARNLNKTYDFGGGVVKNQLVNLDDLKLLSGFTGLAGAPVNASLLDTTQPLEMRARAYLDVNCAHCHNARGYASQSGLLLTYDNIGSASATDTWGVCKLPLAYVGTGQPGYKYDINPGSPDTSILLYRLSHVGSGQTMPVVGRQTNHAEAIAMVGDWIRQLTQASCAP
ncbi:MAG TPA: SO2930 family diheme c-type cytochrome [Burkholderiaceae bacterium]|nr:SO2930 family diheme c-type cytochrome [Burkholderiaceae bacterium]